MTGNHYTNKYKPKEIISNGISLTKPKLIAEAFNNYFIDSVDEISKNLSSDLTIEHQALSTTLYLHSNINEMLSS